MKYISISEPIFRDLLTAKAQMNDIIELVNDSTFRPNAREWREYLKQIISKNNYIKEDEQ
jgi:hypothetical protein